MKTVFSVLIGLGLVASQPRMGCGEGSCAGPKALPAVELGATYLADGAGPGQSILTVDEDERILLKYGSRRPRVVGYQVTLPSRLARPQEIPSDQFIIRVRSLTSNDHRTTLWAVLTVGPPAPNELSETSNWVYVFRQSGNRISLLQRERYADVVDMELCEITGNGSTNLSVQYIDDTAISPSTWIKIWQVSFDGLLPVRLDNILEDLKATISAHKSEMLLGEIQRGDFTLYTEQEIAQSTGIQTIHRFYKWNESRRAYDLVETNTTEERAVP